MKSIYQDKNSSYNLEIDLFKGFGFLIMKEDNILYLTLGPIVISYQEHKILKNEFKKK